jgi:hypothetical protein
MNALMTARALRVARLLPFAALAAGCITHNVESKPIEIKPIHITMDINLRVQKELENFFDFEDTAPAATGAASGTQQGEE